MVHVRQTTSRQKGYSSASVTVSVDAKLTPWSSRGVTAVRSRRPWSLTCRASSGRSLHGRAGGLQPGCGSGLMVTLVWPDWIVGRMPHLRGVCGVLHILGQHPVCADPPNRRSGRAMPESAPIPAAVWTKGQRAEERPSAEDRRAMRSPSGSLARATSPGRAREESLRAHRETRQPVRRCDWLARQALDPH